MPCNQASNSTRKTHKPKLDSPLKLEKFKILTLNPRQKLSLQSHTQRDELWVALDPGLEAVVGRKKIKLKVGQRVFIRRGVKHSLQSLNRKRKARVLEISFGKFDEKDITRYDDIYGRI